MSTPKPKHDDPCWCGEAKKYEDCHLKRHLETPLHPKELDKLHRQAAQIDVCLHPDAPSNCGGTIIDAHTLQKAGPIKQIIDSSNHVQTFYPPQRDAGGALRIQSRGWKEASTFRGFCNSHDNSLFDELENQQFTGSERQCFLIGYRAFTHEVYQKLGVNAGNPILKANLDKGLPEAEQIEIQDKLRLFSEATTQGLQDIRDFKAIYDTAFKTNDLSAINYASILFNGDLSVASTGAVMPDFDLNGNRIQTIENLSNVIEGLMFGTVSTPTGGAFVFSWPTKYTICSDFVDQVISIPYDDLPSFLVEFIFAYVENTYFSEAWWDSLDKLKQERIMSLAVPVLYGMHVRYSGYKYTNWKVTAIAKKITR